MARLIGVDIREAVNWTQDKLKTTRPLAEAVVSSMIADRVAIIGDSGIILFEDDEEIDIRFSNKSFDLKTQKRIRFHAIRKYNKSRHSKPSKIQFDWNNANAAANDMIQEETNNEVS